MTQAPGCASEISRKQFSSFEEGSFQASVAGLTGTALNMLVAVYSVVPKLIFVLTYATLCFLVG